MKNKQKTNSRRDFILRPVRWAAAVVITGISASLLSRRSSATKETCSDPQGRIGCGDCQVLPGCRLPRGLTFKQFLRRKDA